MWCVVETRDGPRLASVIKDDLWPVGVEFVAQCHEDRHHAAPVETCTCGIYAAREPSTVWTYLRGRNDPPVVRRVLGRVALWGRVVEHEHGWRASHALPLDLYA